MCGDGHKLPLWEPSSCHIAPPATAAAYCSTFVCRWHCYGALLQHTLPINIRNRVLRHGCAATTLPAVGLWLALWLVLVLWLLLWLRLLVLWLLLWLQQLVLWLLL
jgi:hypothetical protein